MKVTLNIPVQKFNFLMELLNNFDYIQIEKTEIIETDNDWWDLLTPIQQERIKASIAKLDKGEYVSNEDVRIRANKLLRG
jgi:hypothetical protein